MNIKYLKKGGSKGFKYLAGINRPVSPGHVTTLATSILKFEKATRSVIVAKISFLTGKPEWYVIDGQHLMNALIRLNMDIPYLEVDVHNEEDLIAKIALLNASSKTWKLTDFITAWSFLKKDFIVLNKYFNIYDIELRTLANILAGNSIDSAIVTKQIKTGTFQVKNEDEAVKILNLVTDVLKVIPRMPRGDNRYAINEFVNFYKRHQSSYNHKKFIERLKANQSFFILATQEPGKLVTLFETLV